MPKGHLSVAEYPLAKGIDVLTSYHATFRLTAAEHQQHFEENLMVFQDLLMKVYVA